jgi:hypothetical protein
VPDIDDTPPVSEEPSARSAAPGRRRDALRFVAAVGASAALAGLFFVVFPDDDSGTGAGTAMPEFAPRYDGLAERTRTAGVSTMGEPQDPAAHFHPHLSIYVDGERVRIPVNVGIDPDQPPEEMASLHTHESDGTIHVEGMAEATLGQLFAVWGLPFSQAKLGSFDAAPDDTIRMWVDGQPSREFGALNLSDGQRIVIAFGDEDETPAEVTG